MSSLKRLITLSNLPTSYPTSTTKLASTPSVPVPPAVQPGSDCLYPEEEEEKVSSLALPRVMGSSLTAALIRTKSGGGKKSKTKSLTGDGSTWAPASQSIPHMKYRFPDNKEFRFIQTSELLAALVQSNVGFTGYSASFSSAAIIQFSSFSAVFDQYKLTMIELWIVPRHYSTSSPVAASDYGLLYSVVDYDDSTNLTTPSAFEQYENCVVSPSTNGHYRKFVPHMAVASYGGTFTQYANQPFGWVDCASTGTIGYGVKMGVSACDATSDTNTYDLIYRIHVSFRNVR